MILWVENSIQQEWLICHDPSEPHLLRPSNRLLCVAHPPHREDPPSPQVPQHRHANHVDDPQHLHGHPHLAVLLWGSPLNVPVEKFLRVYWDLHRAVAGAHERQEPSEVAQQELIDGNVVEERKDVGVFVSESVVLVVADSNDGDLLSLVLPDEACELILGVQGWGLQLYVQDDSLELLEDCLQGWNLLLSALDVEGASKVKFNFILEGRQISIVVV